MKSVHEQKGLAMETMAVPRYILELRDEIKSLRAEVELLKPNKPKCGNCGEYKESYTHFSMATGMTNMHWICLNNECQE